MAEAERRDCEGKRRQKEYRRSEKGQVVWEQKVRRMTEKRKIESRRYTVKGMKWEVNNSFKAFRSIATQSSGRLLL